MIQQYSICFALCFVVEKPVWKLVLQLYPCLVDCTTSPSPSVCKALRDALHEYADLLSPPATVITNGTTWHLIKPPGTKSDQARSLSGVTHVVVVGFSHVIVMWPYKRIDMCFVMEWELDQDWDLLKKKVWTRSFVLLTYSFHTHRIYQGR